MAKKPTEKKVKRVNRTAAANRILAEFRGRSTLSALAAEAEALVVGSGGEANPRATAGYVRRAMETAEALGAVELTRPTDVLVIKK
jgi:hypothetical protein